MLNPRCVLNPRGPHQIDDVNDEGLETSMTESMSDPASDQTTEGVDGDPLDSSETDTDTSR